MPYGGLESLLFYQLCYPLLIFGDGERGGGPVCCIRNGEGDITYQILEEKFHKSLIHEIIHKLQRINDF